MNNLAIRYAKLGRYGEALELHQQTLAAYKAKLGEDHTNTTQCMTALAKTYAAMGQYADAVNLQELSLSIRKAKLGRNNFTIPRRCSG